MKMITLMITLLFLCNAYAGNWVNESDFNKAKAKQSDVTVYATEERCIAAKGSNRCFEITGIDSRRFQVAQADDLDQPIFRAINQSPVLLECNNFDDCQAKATDPDGDPGTDDRVCIAEAGAVERWDEKANHNGLGQIKTDWFIWCELITGYVQTKQLIPDPDGAAAADAEDAQAATDKAARDTAKANRKGSGKDSCVAAVNANGNLSQNEIKDCINLLVKEVFDEDIAVGDL